MVVVARFSTHTGVPAAETMQQQQIWQQSEGEWLKIVEAEADLEATAAAAAAADMMTVVEELNREEMK